MDEEEKLKKLLHDANQISRKIDLLLAKSQRQEEKLKNIENQSTRSRKNKTRNSQKLKI